MLLLLLSLCLVKGIELDLSQAVADAESQHLVIPEEHRYRISTLNHYGYTFTKFDPVVKEFLQSIEQNSNQTFFEVGGAYGNVAEAALEKGVGNYYLNDSEERHLKSFAWKLKQNGKLHLAERLHLISGRCPEDVALAENSVDAILVNKVLHFFTPDTIDAFVQWLNQGLKPGGRVFVFTISPYYRGVEELLEEYQKKKQAGDRFPGYFPTFQESNPAQKYGPEARPANLLFMDLDTLKHLFLQHGFQIEKEFELAVINSERHEWESGQDMVGIIAKK